jgi:hypothetical protein
MAIIAIHHVGIAYFWNSATTLMERAETNAKAVFWEHFVTRVRTISSKSWIR